MEHGSESENTKHNEKLHVWVLTKLLYGFTVENEVKSIV